MKKPLYNKPQFYIPVLRKIQPYICTVKVYFEEFVILCGRLYRLYNNRNCNEEFGPGFEGETFCQLNGINSARLFCMPH